MTVTKCGRRENREIRENRENRGADKSRDFWLDIFLEANEIGNGRRHSRDEWYSYDRLCLQEKNLTSRLAGTPLQNRTFEFRDFQVNFANFATSPHPRSQRPDHSHHRPSLAAAVNMEHSLVSVWRRGHRGVSQCCTRTDSWSSREIREVRENRENRVTLKSGCLSYFFKPLRNQI